jgi:hypothetical protein
MKFRECPNLVTAMELLATAAKRRVREDIADQVIPFPHDSEAVLAEEACALLNGSPIRTFVSTEGTMVDCEQDALQHIIEDKTNIAARIIHELGDPGEALDAFLEDALDGELQGVIFE